MRPGKKSLEIIKRDSRVISPSLGKRESPLVYKMGDGCHIWDEDGAKYLDFAASIGVMGIGHNNPEVRKAIEKQARIGIHAGFCDFYAKLPVEFAEKVVAFLPRPLEKVFLSNSGTESIEAAYKLARWHTKKEWTIAFENSFHGRTMGSLSMTNSKPVQRERYAPFLPVKHVPYPYAYRMNMEPEECSAHCLSALEKTIREHEGNIASLFMEPVQGEGGYIVPPKSFVKGVEKLCQEHNILLCADEVQSGCYRTGTFMAISNFNVQPDIVSFSKAIGGGLPLGATISSSKIMDWPSGSHANTFGGNLLACAAGMAALDFMKKKKLGDNAVRVGKIIRMRLNGMKDRFECVGDVRGLGLMIGVEIVQSKTSRQPDVKKRDEIIMKAYEGGLILLPAGKSVVRMCPPLIITKEQAMQGLEIFEKILKETR